jgi:CRISPR-associated helicase Cas3
MNTKTFHFKPQYLQLADESALGVNLHKFQALIKDIWKQPEDIFFIDAPTASGKTFSFLLPTACGTLTIRRVKTLIISPTNLLIEQTYNDIHEKIMETPEIADIHLAKITGTSFEGMTLFERAKMVREDFKIADIIISNPDIIALFLTGFYDISHNKKTENEFRRSRSTPDIFSELDVIIFDEYHVYSEEESGKIAALIYLSKMMGNIPKVIFTSATPQNKLKELLIELGFKCAEFHENSFEDEKPGSRQIRGKIDLTVTDQPIIEALDPNIDEEKKALYLFDHKIEAEISREKIIEMGLKSIYIQDLSGFSNRAGLKQIPSENVRCIIATNAAEQGLNLDVTDSHIEPGLYIENLTQRYGRIGRKGKPGSITIHFKAAQMEQIPEEISDFTDLISNLEKVFFRKDIFLSRIKRHFAAFMALCTIRDARSIFGHQIQESLKILNDPLISEIYQSFVSFDTATKKLSSSRYPDPGDINDLNWWWNRFLLSIGFFRGQSLSVPVGLERDGGIMRTTENIIWVKKWCNTEVTGMGRDSIYLIRSFKQIPAAVDIEYCIPGQKLKVTERDVFDREKFIQVYFGRISDFIKTAFEDSGVNIQQMLRDLYTLLKTLYPGMLMPREVELVSESQII